MHSYMSKFNIMKRDARSWMDLYVYGIIVSVLFLFVLGAAAGACIWLGRNRYSPLIEEWYVALAGPIFFGVALFVVLKFCDWIELRQNIKTQISGRMTKEKERRLWMGLGIIVLFGVSLATGTYIYFHTRIPIERMMDESWWENASQDEIRKLSHRALRTRLDSNHHDAFLALADIGNAKSVPLLIRALKWQDPPDEEGSMVCTTAHCVSALKSLTGHDVAYTFQEWNKWWKETGSKLPPEAFYPRQEKEFPYLGSQQ